MNPPKQHPRKYRQKLALRFSPTAWAKLLFFRDHSSNEIGGFGISDPDDLLYIREFVTIKQEVSIVQCTIPGRLRLPISLTTRLPWAESPNNLPAVGCIRIPEGISTPSQTDEETFERVFGSCQWAVMFILSQDNQAYARISFNIGPGGQLIIPVQVDYSKPFEASDPVAWEQEFKQNILTHSMDKLNTHSATLSTNDARHVGSSPVPDGVSDS